MKKSIGAKTIVYPTPVFVVGSYDEQGRPNIMTASWGGICSSEPPSIAVSIRPSRYTYENITRRRAFTINIPSAAHAKAADYAGIYSGRNEDKFAATGLTALPSALVDAPLIKEFPLVLECQLLHTFDLGVHTQFIGQIMDVQADESVLDAAGNVDVEKVQPICFAPGNQAYYGLGALIGKAFSLGRTS